MSEARPPVTVVVADDQSAVREGLLLGTLPGIAVVGEAHDGDAAAQAVAAAQPQVVLMDLTMPGLNGIEGTAQAASKCPGARTLILSMHTDEEHVLQALRAGAVGYLVKDSVPAELELAVRAAARGETYLSPAVAKHVVAARAQGSGEEKTALERLTPRLREVLQLIAEGHTTKEIARILKTRPKTVENHRARLMQRLHIREVAGLVRYAIRSGMIEARP